MSILEDEFVMDAAYIYKCLFDKFVKDFKVSKVGKAYKRLTRLCSSAFLLGYEYGKEDLRRNIALMEEDIDRDDNQFFWVGPKPKESETLNIINNLQPGLNTFEFSDSLTAHKKADAIRSYAKNHSISFKMKKEKNFVYIIKE